MLFLPLLVLLSVLTTLSVAVWLSALNVMYRDVQYIIPFMVQLWMFLSPVIWPVDKVPEGIWRTIFALNPVAGVIQGFRWAILGGDPPSKLLAVSVTVVAILFITGLFYFKRMERTFADVV
jgi:lipopolysaccharide transport system permease protein